MSAIGIPTVSSLWGVQFFSYCFFYFNYLFFCIRWRRTVWSVAPWTWRKLISNVTSPILSSNSWKIIPSFPSSTLGCRTSWGRLEWSSWINTCGTLTPMPSRWNIYFGAAKSEPLNTSFIWMPNTWILVFRWLLKVHLNTEQIVAWLSNGPIVLS